MTRSRSDPRHDVLGREWITRSAARASARLALDEADLKRLRRRGFIAAALDKDVLRRHNRRYTTVLPFGQVENQQQSGNCWLFAPIVLVRAAALQKGCITASESFSETYLYFFDRLENAMRFTVPRPRGFAYTGSPPASSRWTARPCAGASSRR